MADLAPTGFSVFARRRKLDVVFIDQPAQSLRLIRISAPSGLSGFWPRLTVACHDHAVDYGYTHWIQPHEESGGQATWDVFRNVDARKREWLKRFPSREAAEMWVLHRE